MIGAVHKYHRKISENVDNIKNSIDIASLLIKSQEVDLKIKDIENDNNENLTLIQTKINDIENINTKVTNNYNITQINKKNIDFKTGIIDNQITAINSTLNNLKTKYSIENFFIYNIEIENNYKLSKDIPRFSIFNYNLIDEFRKDDILEINCRLLYQYTNYNNIGFLIHIFKLYDSAGTMFYEYKSLLTNSGDNRKNDLKQSDIFYVKLDDDFDIIKIELILSIIDNVTNIVDCKLYNTYNSNFLCIKYIKKNYI